MLKKALLALSVAVLTLTQLAGQTQSTPSQPPPQQKPAFTLKELGKGVYAAVSTRAGGNSGFVIGNESVLVIDTFINQAPTTTSWNWISVRGWCASSTSQDTPAAIPPFTFPTQTSSSQATWDGTSAFP